MKCNVLKGFSVVVVLPAFLLMAACGSKNIAIEPAPLPPVEEQRVAWEKNWEVDTGHGDDDLYLNLQPGIIESAKSKHANVIYTADHRGRVMAIDALSGDVIWSEKVPDTAFISGVGVGEKNVVIGTQEGEVIALDAQTGEPRWRTPVSSEVLAAPGVKDGYVAILAVDSHVYGLSEHTGHVLWDAPHTAPLLKLRGGASPVMHDNVVFVGFADGRLSIFDRKTGHVFWQQTVAIPQGRSEVERMIDINGRMAIYGNTLYVVTYQGKVMAYDYVRNGARWTKDMSSYVGLTGAGQTLVVTDEDGIIWGLSSSTGKVLWEQKLLRYRALTTPSIIDDTVMVGDDDGNVHLLSLENGEWLGFTKIDSSGVRAKPIIIDDTAIVYARDGALVSVTPKM